MVGGGSSGDDDADGTAAFEAKLGFVVLDWPSDIDATFDDALLQHSTAESREHPHPHLHPYTYPHPHPRPRPRPRPHPHPHQHQHQHYRTQEHHTERDGRVSKDSILPIVGATHGADAAELVRNYVEETLEFANEYYAGIHEFEGDTAEEPHDVAAVRLVSRQKKNAAAAVQAPVVLARRSPRIQREDWVVISPNERLCNVTDC